jgi:hypothetical protein
VADGAVTSTASITTAVENEPRVRNALWFALLLAALLVSRWALAPRYLITFDQINFALALDDFNPALHQPQPPGYPLFVGFLKLIGAVVADVETVFLLAAILASVVSLVLLWLLGDRIAGGAAGLVAAWLLLFNPAFWLAALTNPVRLSLAAGAISVALCLWLACRHQSPRWLLTAAFMLGIAAGFRPALAVLMFPLAAWVALWMHARLTTIGGALICFLVAVGTWLPVLAAEAGGWRAFVDLIGDYSTAQLGPTSFLWGAALREWLGMAWKAVVWSCLGVLSWIWAVPAALRKGHGVDALRARFLLWWFVPGLLFYASFHTGDPDHTLSIVPVTCVAGAIVLTRISRGASVRKRALIISIAVLLNVFLFLKPISKTAAASTNKPVRWLDRHITEVVDGVRAVRGRGPLSVMFHESVTGWRQLSYYEPEVPILTYAAQNGSAVVTEIRGTRAETRTSADGAVHLPACRSLVWVDVAGRPTDTAVIHAINSRVFLAAAAGESFELRGIRFVSEPGSCGDESGL